MAEGLPTGFDGVDETRYAKSAFGWTPALKSACQDRCGEFGDPSCCDVVAGCDPCDECLTEIYGLQEIAAPRCPLTKDMLV